MQEIVLTIFERKSGLQFIQPMLDAFERSHKIHVNLQLLSWESAWSTLVDVALKEQGPDISEVGSTWVMDFVRMNAVSNLYQSEATRIGSEKDFFPTNWQSCTAKNPASELPLVWAVPWTADVRLSYYRKDFFEKANLDPTHVFDHVDLLSAGIQTLSAKGIAFPSALSTLRSHINLHHIASWLWDAGGDFLTTDATQVAFSSPEALRGLREYFKLGEYIPAAHRKIDDLVADQLFVSGEAATVFSGWWLTVQSMASDIHNRFGVAAMPGSSFVGGTHLLTWKHSRKREQAFLLAEFMVKHAVEYNVFPSNSLPAYIPSWDSIQFIDEPNLSVVRDALQRGRSFPTGQLWGMVEKRLTDVVPMVWERIFDRGSIAVDEILAETIVPLARRINVTLG